MLLAAPENSIINNLMNGILLKSTKTWTDPLQAPFNAGNADGAVFHFTTPQGARGILNDGFISPSSSGVAGPGVYTGTNSIPNFFQKNTPFIGYGLGGKGANVRIPVLNPTQSSFTPWLPPQTQVFRGPLSLGGSQ